MKARFVHERDGVIVDSRELVGDAAIDEVISAAEIETVSAGDYGPEDASQVWIKLILEPRNPVDFSEKMTLRVAGGERELRALASRHDFDIKAVDAAIESYKRFNKVYSDR